MNHVYIGFCGDLVGLNNPLTPSPSPHALHSAYRLMSNCFIRQVSLIPAVSRSSVCRTDIVCNSAQPVYDEKFSL